MAQVNTGAVRGYDYDQLPTLGLGESRRRKGISLEDIADRTKISIRFLRAIEAEEFGKLPGGIFTTSYLRQYASSIGLDENWLVGYAAQASSQPEVPVEPRSGSDNVFVRFLRASTAAGR